MPQAQQEEEDEKENGQNQNVMHLDTLRRQELQVQILGG